MTSLTYIISTSDTQRKLVDEAANTASTADTTRINGNGTRGGQDHGMDVVTIVAMMNGTDNSNHRYPKIRRLMRLSNRMDIFVVSSS